MTDIKHFINVISINGLEDLWKKENPDSSEITLYNRSSGTRSTIKRAYTDIKMASNTKVNHIMVSFTDHYNAILGFFRFMVL